MIGKPGFFGEGDLPEALAKLSGLTTAQIRTQQQAGKSLADIAKAEGVSTSTLISETVKIETAECDSAVKAGTITTAEKDKVLTDITARLTSEIARTGAPGGPGGAGGPGNGTPPAGSGAATAAAQ